jgi:hypothetical protein
MLRAEGPSAQSHSFERQNSAVSASLRAPSEVVRDKHLSKCAEPKHHKEGFVIFVA